MPANSTLIKDWIQFLKNRQIVSLNSDPKTGKLNYKRKVTTDDLSRFLEVKTDFTPDAINNAIQMVLAKRASGNQQPKLQNNPTPTQPGTDVSTWMANGMRPAEHPTKNLTGKETTKLKYDPDSISDIDFKDVPNKKPKSNKLGLKEEITDTPATELSEKDVEDIFSILISGAEKANTDRSANKQTSATPAKPEITPDEIRLKKETDMRKLKRMIRDVMTDNQRRALWRALNEI